MASKPWTMTWVCVLGQGGACRMGHADHGSSGLFGHCVGADGLGGGAAQRSGDHDGVLPQPGGSIGVELIGGEVVGPQASLRCGPRSTCRDTVQLWKRRSPQNHIFHGVAGNDIGHDVLHVVHINVIHSSFSFFRFYDRGFVWYGRENYINRESG